MAACAENAALATALAALTDEAPAVVLSLVLALVLAAVEYVAVDAVEELVAAIVMARTQRVAVSQFYTSVLECARGVPSRIMETSQLL